MHFEPPNPPNFGRIFTNRYAVWFAATDHLKRSPSDSLPSWPLWVLFWPVWTVLRRLGVTQAAEFEEALDPSRKYLICCVPHGAYAFSSL